MIWKVICSALRPAEARQQPLLALLKLRPAEESVTLRPRRRLSLPLLSVCIRTFHGFQFRLNIIFVFVKFTGSTFDPTFVRLFEFSPEIPLPGHKRTRETSLACSSLFSGDLYLCSPSCPLASTLSRCGWDCTVLQRTSAYVTRSIEWPTHLCHTARSVGQVCPKYAQREAYSDI